MPGAPSSEHCSGHEMTPFARHRGEALLLAQAVEVQVAVTPRSANVQRGPVWSFRSGSVLRLRLYVLEASRKGQETLIEQDRCGPSSGLPFFGAHAHGSVGRSG